ncbi:MAG TPA: hypothetical protein DDZ51_05525 [Planctomycetaceae bacterium]|nr:hypothetical protein [Planctomycetaceae bacterium]
MSIDLFTAGSRWMNAQLVAHASREILINDRLRNPTLVIDTVATIGKTEFEEVERDGVLTTHTSRDFIVSADSLVDDDGVAIVPQRGWIITDPHNDHRYEVHAPAGQKPYRRSDTDHQRIRIHTRDLDDE